MRTMRYAAPLLLVTALSGIAQAQSASVVVNGGFETWEPVTLDAQGLVSGWKLGQPPLLAENWTLNSAYPGELLRGATDAAEGAATAIIRRSGSTGVHLYQPLTGLEAGKWYQVSARVRGGGLGIMCYQYFAAGPMNSVGVARSAGTGSGWRKALGFYRVPETNWASSSLALSLESGDQVEIDDVRMEAANLPTPPPGAPDIVLETKAVRLVIAPTGHVKLIKSKASGKEYQAEAPLPLVSVLVDGNLLQALTVTRSGDRLEFRFPESSVRVTLAVKTGPRYLRFEVVGFAPANLESIRVSLPMQRLKTVGGAFGATYDEEFGLAFFCASVNSHNVGGAAGSALVPVVEATSAHGLKGAAMALVAAPAKEFRAAVMEAEKGCGLPCPVLGGKWGRDSNSVRRSYLFSTGTTAADIDTLIQYAKLGGFGTIIFLKDDWLANHGHFAINKTNFPRGLADVQAAVRKIHRAGLEAGVHVFGPSISANDPFITPVPDKRLATVPCPPLAEGMDEKSTILALTEAPNLPPKVWDYAGFPGYYVRLGDEIIAYNPKQMDGPSRYLNVGRGALGTKPTAHPAGAEVKGLLAMWGFFLVDPDSTLVDELTANFAKVYNACDFDFAYFDASDGSGPPYVDTWYYLNKLHLAYYRKFKRDALYQTSMGTGSDLVWHIVPRSASADGHGDIKGYLDDRWPGILGMGDNWTKADVGWYYWFSNVRPDQIEYVGAKLVGVDGSMSLETSRAALEKLPQSRQMMEMLGRWDRYRQSGAVPEAIREKLREPKRDFKVFPDGKRWELYRAAYEDPRSVDVLDGKQNSWTITNDRPEPCLLGLEIVRSTRDVAIQGYESPQALALNVFDSAEAFRHTAENPYEKFVVGDKKQVSESGVVREGVTHSYEVSAAEGRSGAPALVYTAENKGAPGGWTGIGRRFPQPLDLRAYRGLGIWMSGDGKGEAVRLQFRDTNGRSADWVPVVDFTGWRLHTFPLPQTEGFDWSQVEYFLVYFNNIPDATKVRVALDGLKMLPALNPVNLPGRPVVTVNGQRVEFAATLGLGEALTHEGVGQATLWPKGMAPGKRLAAQGLPLRLQPGENQVTLTWSPNEAFPSGVDVLFYRLWPLETP